MSKKARLDESGDSDDLQALFDSIASEPAGASTPAPKPAPAVVAPSADGSGDNDELQALFDAVAAEAGAAPAAATEPSATDADGEAVFNRLGQMTRQLHDTLRELGLNQALQEFAVAMPDARQRLDYIAQMTEQAASRVLNATDIARPLQDGLQSGAGALRGRWDQLFAGQLSPDEFRQLSAETRDFLGTVGANSRATNAQLMEIMMAQDFQDLTGQVIKRVVELAQTLESQLLQVLLETAPPNLKFEHKINLMNGPVIDGKRPDVVTTQAQVDDLLESLGF